MKTTQRNHERKAVAPIIATLLMVAIAVVGGILIFVFAQGFFNQTQVSSAPQIESLQVIGYDARTGQTALNLASGTPVTGSDGATSTTKLAQNDNVFVYVRNGGVHDVLLTTVKLAGSTYTVYSTSSAPSVTGPVPTSGAYCVIQSGASTCDTKAIPTIPAGGISTIVFNLADGLKAGQEANVFLQSAQGNNFVGTVIVGQSQ